MVWLRESIQGDVSQCRFFEMHEDGNSEIDFDLVVAIEE